VLKYGPRNWKKIAVEIGGLFTGKKDFSQLTIISRSM
jgi:hypothetical protein